MPYEQQATPEEIKAQKRRCWRPHCKHRAFIRDWAGWQWCFRDWYRSARDHAEGRLSSWYWQIKNLRLFL